MIKSVKELPRVREMLAKANEILGWDLMEWSEKADLIRINNLVESMPAMFVAGCAAAEKLRKDVGDDQVDRAAGMAGLSVGEYCALHIAGVFTFEDGLRIVAERAKATFAAAKLCEQGLLNVVGLEEKKLNKLCEEVAQKNSNICRISLKLFPAGFSVGGNFDSVAELAEMCMKEGAQQAKILGDHGFHTPLMEPAVGRLTELLDDALPRMKTPLHSVWMNASGEPVRPGTDPSEIVALLKRQMVEPVAWEGLLKNVLKELGSPQMYELGPGKTLKGMMKRVDASAFKKTDSIEV